MAARVAAIGRFLADSGQELHELHRSRTPESSRRHLRLLGLRVGRDRAAGNAWKVRILKSLSRRWAKSAITNQSRLTACVQIERPGLEGSSVTSHEGPSAWRTEAENASVGLDVDPFSVRFTPTHPDASPEWAYE